MRTERIVTTSWDDGDPHDMTVARLLHERGLVGTFYVPLAGPHGRPTVNRAGLREFLSYGLEVGAHGTSHISLRQIPHADLARELRVCKSKLQDAVGERICTFSYPKGQYNLRIIHEVEKAGYAGARTTEMLGHRLDTDPYRMSTTLHAFPHTRAAYLKNLARALHFRRALDWASYYHHSGNWIELAKTTFDRVMRDGGAWHLYGHSWAIEKYDLWDSLSEVLDYVAGREGVRYLSNGDLLKFLPHRPRFASADFRVSGP
jgi:peptidoglycan-N-acetylglucosamine deacetylase